MNTAPAKNLLVKKAIREITSIEKYDEYCDVSNQEIFNHMKDNKMGVRWISKVCIKVVRSKLTKQYRERE